MEFRILSKVFAGNSMGVLAEDLNVIDNQVDQLGGWSVILSVVGLTLLS